MSGIMVIYVPGMTRVEVNQKTHLQTTITHAHTHIYIYIYIYIVGDT